MPANLPVPTKSAGDLLTSSLWNSYLRDNINKLLQRQHRVLTVAQFAALSSPEGTKGGTPPDEVYLEVDATNGLLWHLAYESGEATYKWRALGGTPLMSRVATAEATSSTAYVDLTTVGPQVAAPRGGDYDLEWGFFGQNNGNSFSDSAIMLGATVTNIEQFAATCGFTNNAQDSCYMARGRTLNRSANDDIRMRYRAGANTATFRLRWLTVMPVRIL